MRYSDANHFSWLSAPVEVALGMIVLNFVAGNSLSRYSYIKPQLLSTLVYSTFLLWIITLLGWLFLVRNPIMSQVRPIIGWNASPCFDISKQTRCTARLLEVGDLGAGNLGKGILNYFYTILMRVNLWKLNGLSSAGRI